MDETAVPGVWRKWLVGSLGLRRLCPGAGSVAWLPDALSTEKLVSVKGNHSPVPAAEDTVA